VIGDENKALVDGKFAEGAFHAEQLTAALAAAGSPAALVRPERVLRLKPFHVLLLHRAPVPLCHKNQNYIKISKKNVIQQAKMFSLVFVAEGRENLLFFCYHLFFPKKTLYKQ
jgi:hypothetical protein